MKTVNRYNMLTQLRGTALILALLAATASQAAGNTGFRLIAFEDKAQGELVVNGEYAEAIAKLVPQSRSRSEFARHNNLCVAYTKTAELDKAISACDKAVSMRDNTRAGAATYLNLEQIREARDKAIALSNRGVVRAISGDISGAALDFEESLRLHGRLSEPQQNLKLLGINATATASTTQ